MIPTVIEALNIPEAWWRCMEHLFTDNIGWRMYTIDRGSFEGHQRREFDLVVININYPGMAPLVPDVPEGVPAPTTMEYVNDYLPYLMSDARAKDEEYTYGTYLTPQIPKIVKMLRNSPQTNQAFMTVGDPSTIDMTDPPCLRGIQCRVLDGKLHFIVYFRSWDLYAGFPSNLAAIQLLKEYMANEIGIEDGSLNAISPGLHLYDHSWEFARRILKIT